MLDQLATIPDVALLGINAAMGAFVCVAHGGALLIVLTRAAPMPPGYEALVRTWVPVTLPSAALVVVASLVGFVAPNARQLVLRLQALVLFLSGAALVVWAASLILHGIPAGNFSWTPGFLTGWMTYSSFLFCRFVLRTWAKRPAIRHGPLFAAGVTLPIDLGVFLLLIARMSRL